MSLPTNTLCRLLVVSVTFLSLHSARAEILATEAALAAAPQIDRQAIVAFLGRADVARQLESLGVDPRLAQQRAAAMSDQDLEAIAGKLAYAPAGGQMSSGGGGSGGYGGGGPALVLIVIILLVAWLVYMWSPHKSAGETKENARPR
jgi:hypothetical protein